MIEAKRYDYSRYGKLDGVQRAGLEAGTWKPQGWEPDKLDGVAYAKINPLLSGDERQIVKPSLRQIPISVLAETIAVGERAKVWMEIYNSDPDNLPKNWPAHLTVDQLVNAVNTGALYQGEYTSPYREAEREQYEAQKAEKARIAAQRERAARQFVMGSVPVEPIPTHTNGTNGVIHRNGYSIYRNGTNGHKRDEAFEPAFTPVKEPILTK